MVFSRLENQAFKKYSRIAGIDEAGRGSLAGPVAAAIVVSSNKIPKSLFRLKIRDSKRLSAKQRLEVFNIAKQESGIEYKVSFVSPQVIDKTNILEATKLAWYRCLNKLSVQPDFLFLDGNQELSKVKIKQRAVIGGDDKIWLVSLASIMAKVSRDSLMDRLDKKYPEYLFGLHKGYGTRLHLERLNKFGPSQVHRKSFRPICSNLSFEKKSNTINK